MKYADYLRSEHWRLLRGAKLQISPVCEACGTREEIEVHHKLYRDTWFETKLKDLKTLCHYHHVCEHVHGASEAEKQSLLKAEEDKVFKDWKYRANPFVRRQHSMSLEKR